MIKTIYLDMDGVLCDFKSAVVDKNIYNPTKNTINWDLLKSLGSEFWANLQWIREGQRLYAWLFKFCIEQKITLCILSSIGFREGKVGKQQWIEKEDTGTESVSQAKKGLASDSFKRAVRLHSTFASSGPLSTDQILEYYNQHDDHRGLLFHLEMAGLAAIDPERLEGYTPKDFIPEWMLTTQYEVEGATYTYYDLWMQNKPFAYAIISGNYQMLLWQLADVLASDMMDEEGHLLDASPKVQVLRKILAEENDWDSWTPQTPIYLMHHPKDGGVPYEPAHQLYQSFASRGGNVFWADDTLPFILESDPMVIHFAISYLDIFRALSCEFPSEMSTTLQSIN